MRAAVLITDLEVMTRIGVPSEERAAAQRLLISIECDVVHTSEDRVSIDYAHVAERLHQLAEHERETLEKFCDDIGVMLVKEFGSEHFTIEVKKFVIPGAASVSYRLSTK